MDHVQIIKDIKNKVYHPVYFLTGEETYYIDLISDYIEKNVLDETEKDFKETLADIGTTQAGKAFNAAADEEPGVPASTNIPSTVLPAARSINMPEKTNKFNDMLSTPRENEEPG